MEMKKLYSGKLRVAGYDARARQLQVELDDGSRLQYANVGEEIWRKLSTSAAAWSYYRDVIEEEFSANRLTAGTASDDTPLGNNPPSSNPLLDDLFRKD